MVEIRASKCRCGKCGKGNLLKQERREPAIYNAIIKAISSH